VPTREMAKFDQDVVSPFTKDNNGMKVKSALQTIVNL